MTSPSAFLLPLYLTLVVTENVGSTTMSVSPYSTDMVGSGAEAGLPEPPFIVLDNPAEEEDGDERTCEDSRLRDVEFYHSLRAMRRQLDTMENLFTRCCLGCPDGYLNPAGTRSCYRIAETEESWWRARQICQEEGGDLLSLQTAQEEFSLTNYISQNKGVIKFPLRFYTSGNELETKGYWTWRTGADAELFTHVNWGRNEPNDSEMEREECVEYNYGYGWNDVPCYLPLRYICETDMYLINSSDREP